MPIEPDLLEILVCPETHQSLSLANAETLEELNSQIEAKRLRNRGGEIIDDPVAEGLLREDGEVLYLIDDDIPIMLIDKSIELA